ncbi:MAG: aminotransferase class I/II-fold pyridoxal phosphate-dependent enzyme [Thermoguttaceae bacterium]|jgi:perosamine synthetase|nr:aminotransferase class I/II-fold pyridoxal phosphate-dependent enzyme [Thermoguttaceae bacterium]
MMTLSPPAPAEVSARNRRIDAFRRAVEKSFRFLKETARLDDLFARGLPLAGNQGYLVPLCRLHVGDDDLIRRLAQWRRENAFAYPSQFPVTFESTAAWLRQRVLAVEDRLLFLVLDRLGRTIGHLGFANASNDAGEIELDNVVRGVTGVEPGIMANAVRTLLGWALEHLRPSAVFLRVLDDNHHAIEFYRRLGFVEDRTIPLRRHEADGRVDYLPLAEGDVAPPDKSFLRMVYTMPARTTPADTILTAGPSISARETAYVLDAVRHGWNRNWSGYLDRFEKAFAEYVGAKHALATSSGTGALHLALAALGIGPGDEVIVPDLTWVATANAVMYVGATPVFADVEPDTWCLDPASFEAAITERTRAVIPVHLYGHPARMDRIVEIARRHGLFVVEDAAPAIGAEFQGRRVGALGDVGCFSFQGAKLVVTGEGGMLVTHSDEIYARAHALWDQGRTPGTFWINELGWKYKMSNLQAALGLGQLERVDEFIEAKREIFAWYAEGLCGVPHLVLNEEAPWARSIYWMTSVVLDERAGISRDEFRDRLRQRKIDTRPVFPAISRYRFWPRQQPPQPVARRLGEQGINLPSGICLQRDQVGYICDCIRELLGKTG